MLLFGVPADSIAAAFVRVVRFREFDEWLWTAAPCCPDPWSRISIAHTRESWKRVLPWQAAVRICGAGSLPATGATTYLVKAPLQFVTRSVGGRLAGRLAGCGVFGKAFQPSVSVRNSVRGRLLVTLEHIRNGGVHGTILQYDRWVVRWQIHRQPPISVHVMSADGLDITTVRLDSLLPIGWR